MGNVGNKRWIAKIFQKITQTEDQRTLNAHSHCTFFLIATASPLIAINGLHRTQWKCLHYVTATISPAPVPPIVSKIRSQLKIAQCEQALKFLLFHHVSFITIFLKLPYISLSSCFHPNRLLTVPFTSDRIKSCCV